MLSLISPLLVNFGTVTKHQLARCMRPRTNERHLPTQDIEKLWKLIDAGAAQPAAYSRDPLVVADSPLYLRPLLHDNHRSELEDKECLVVKAVASLREKDRSARVELYHDSDYQHGWR